MEGIAVEGGADGEAAAQAGAASQPTSNPKRSAAGAASSCAAARDPLYAAADAAAAAALPRSSNTSDSSPTTAAHVSDSGSSCGATAFRAAAASRIPRASSPSDAEVDDERQPDVHSVPLQLQQDSDQHRHEQQPHHQLQRELQPGSVEVAASASHAQKPRLLEISPGKRQKPPEPGEAPREAAGTPTHAGGTGAAATSSSAAATAANGSYAPSAFPSIQMYSANFCSSEPSALWRPQPDAAAGAAHTFVGSASLQSFLLRSGHPTTPAAGRAAATEAAAAGSAAAGAASSSHSPDDELLSPSACVAASPQEHQQQPQRAQHAAGAGGEESTAATGSCAALPSAASSSFFSAYAGAPTAADEGDIPARHERRIAATASSSARGCFSLDPQQLLDAAARRSSQLGQLSSAFVPGDTRSQQQPFSSPQRRERHRPHQQQQERPEQQQQEPRRQEQPRQATKQGRSAERTAAPSAGTAAAHALRTSPSPHGEGDQQQHQQQQAVEDEQQRHGSSNNIGSNTSDTRDSREGGRPRRSGFEASLSQQPWEVVEPLTPDCSSSSRGGGGRDSSSSSTATSAAAAPPRSRGYSQFTEAPRPASTSPTAAVRMGDASSPRCVDAAAGASAARVALPASSLSSSPPPPPPPAAGVRLSDEAAAAAAAPPGPAAAASREQERPAPGRGGTAAGQQRPVAAARAQQQLAREAAGRGAAAARQGTGGLRYLNSVIQQGWLEKWTNLVSSWRPRYFYVLPGLCKYCVQKHAPPKEVFMLNQCVIRLCPHDPVRFEVEVIDQQTLYLRTETLEEKQLWYAAFKQAQRALVCTPSRRLLSSGLPQHHPTSSMAAAAAAGKAASSGGAGEGGGTAALTSRLQAAANIAAALDTATATTSPQRPRQQQQQPQRSHRMRLPAPAAAQAATTAAAAAQAAASRRHTQKQHLSHSSRELPSELSSDLDAGAAPAGERGRSGTSSGHSSSRSVASSSVEGAREKQQQGAHGQSPRTSAPCPAVAAAASKPRPQQQQPSASSSSASSSLSGVLAEAVSCGVSYAAAFASSKLRQSLLGAALPAPAAASAPTPAPTAATPGAVPPPPPLPAPGSSPARVDLRQQEQQQRRGVPATAAGQSELKRETEDAEAPAAAAAAAPEPKDAGPLQQQQPPEDEEEYTGLAKTQQQLQHSSSGDMSSCTLPLEAKESSPLVLLLENVMAAREQLQTHGADIRALQAAALKEAGGGSGVELRRQLVALLKKIDMLQSLIERHFVVTEGLLAEESLQRRQLEKSLRSLAKENYKLEKAQQRRLLAARSIDGSGAAVGDGAAAAAGERTAAADAKGGGGGGAAAAPEEKQRTRPKEGAPPAAAAPAASAEEVVVPEEKRDTAASINQQQQQEAGTRKKRPPVDELLLSGSSDEAEDDEDEFFECEDEEAYRPFEKQFSPPDSASQRYAPPGEEAAATATVPEAAAAVTPAAHAAEVPPPAPPPTATQERKAAWPAAAADERKEATVAPAVAAAAAAPPAGPAVPSPSAAGAAAAPQRQEHEENLVPVVSPAYNSIALLLNPHSKLSVVSFLEAAVGRVGGPMQHHRVRLPKPRTEFKIGLWSVLKDCIGKDLSRISMPVYFNEPTSFLQRLLEDFQYADLIYAAPLFSESVDRLLLVTLFAATPYASATGRTYKPFNPLLGETFEFTHRGYRFLAEQVGHHPPRTAYHVENERLRCWGDVAVRNRFTGKSLEVTMPGTIHLVFSSTPRQQQQQLEHFTYRRVKLLVHNVIWGKLWAELDGTTLIQNQTTGDYSILQFVRKGWLDKSMHMMRGIIFTAAGHPVYRLTGTWSHALYFEEYDQSRSSYAGSRIHLRYPGGLRPVTAAAMKTYWRSDGPPPADSPDNKLQQVLDAFWDALPIKEHSRRLIWRPAARPPHSDAFYGFGYLTMELNEVTPQYDPRQGAVIPRTDARFRPDQRYYEEGRLDEAVQEKTRLEEKQREAARQRLRGEDDYEALWFEKGKDEITHEPAWLYKGGYWEAKESPEGFCNSPDIF